MKKNINSFIDLFAGCGGMFLGASNAGLKAALAIEIDENASKTYQRNLKSPIINTDIRNVENHIFPQVDLVLGGFPCQPFSLAGLQRGFDGKDGDLFYQCLRVLNVVKPKAFIFENVAGFLRLQNGLWMKQALKELNKLGYTVTYKSLNSFDYGLPQKRERLLRGRQVEVVDGEEGFVVKLIDFRRDPERKTGQNSPHPSKEVGDDDPSH